MQTTQNLVCSCKDLEQHQNNVDRKLEILKTWFDVNKLSLNTKKTKFIVFGNQKEIDGDIELKISYTNIERVFETKFPEVVIDHKLS